MFCKKLFFLLNKKKWIIQLIIKETEIMLNRAKDYYENDKERLRQQARNIEIYLKKIKRKRENMEKIDTIICLKKRSKN